MIFTWFAVVTLNVQAEWWDGIISFSFCKKDYSTATRDMKSKEAVRAA